MRKSMKLFNKILIANRGEIAIRINRAAKSLGIPTVAIFSEADAASLHKTVADEARCIGKEALSETYLNIEKIVHTAKQSGCDAIHPGYGFLAENSKFVEATQQAGLAFIGPSANVMALMGNKIKAREFIKSINIPLVGGAVGKTNDSLLKAAQRIPFPLLLKAAGGGGGKGMRVVREDGELKSALETTRREALSYFGDGTIYIEQYLEDPRHIEIQVMGDHYGNVVHLFERECSIQRRYQKIIEESPSPTLTPELRQEMGSAAVRIGKEIGYNNAGTIEFLVDQNLNFYFLEMNTRIQVEHPVTEMITGLDLVREQILVSAGNPLSFSQDDIRQNGHAIEARIYAEDPAHGFLPSPGIMTCYAEPVGDTIRVDSSTDKSTEIKSFFDPMVGKLIVHGNDRKKATQKLDEALGNYIIHGIKTNIPYLLGLIRNKDFKANRISTTWCDHNTHVVLKQISDAKQQADNIIPLLSFIASTLFPVRDIAFPSRSTNLNIWDHIGYWRTRMRIPVQLDDKEIPVTILKSNYPHFVAEIGKKKHEVTIDSFSGGVLTFSINNQEYKTWISPCGKLKTCISFSGHQFEIARNDQLPDEVEYHLSEGAEMTDTNVLTSPMPGKVIKINAKKGVEIKKGNVVLVIEAMKMENNIIAHRDARINKIPVSVGQMVEAGVPLVYFEQESK